MKTDKQTNELVGVIGGIGPEATNYFTSLLIKLRQPYAQKDQDHIPFLVFNNPQVPDRTEYLLNGAENPLPELIKTGRALKKAGATFLVMTCNTAHPFAEEIEKQVGLELLNMIDLTVKYIAFTYGKGVKVGLLATDGTIKSKVYRMAFRNFAPNTSIYLPDQAAQKGVMKAIYQIKADGVTKESVKLLKKAAKQMVDRGADVIILGCTEIPLALKTTERKYKYIDPMEILAQHVIERTVYSKPTSSKSQKRFWDLFSQAE